MFVASVTGTNGKTSVAELARHLLASAGEQAGSWGTRGVRDASGSRLGLRVGVGPEAAPRFLNRLENRGLSALTFEAYSTVLHRGLLDQVEIDAAVFTTFGRDHLNFHETRDAYFQAKKRLFEEVADKETTAILNANANRVGKLMGACSDRGLPIRTYGTSDQTDAQLVAADPTDEGLRVQARLYERKVEREVPLFARPMAENLLAASLITLSSGKSLDDVLQGWKSLQTPPGRMERVACHRGTEIYVDYAHTPGALKSLLVSLSARCAGRRLLVFGCGGDRDEGKRAEMGRVAHRHAECSFVTDDNPRSENPGRIRAQILETCPGGEEIPHRRAAIRRAIEVSNDGDTIVIAGKGHEDCQIRSETQRPFSDRKVAQELVA